jgi:hypothetical protein
MDDGHDPGWRGAFASAWTMMVPGLQRRRMARAAEQSDGAVIVMRSLWASFTVALAMIGVVVLILWLGSDLGTDATTSTAVALAIVLVASATSLAVGTWLARRRLDCSSLPALAASYRQQFFLRVAVAESAALIAFAGFVISGAPWLYLIGLAVAWWQLFRFAPTTAHLAAEQERLRWADCQLRLLDALALPAQPPPGSRSGGGNEPR